MGRIGKCFRVTQRLDAMPKLWEKDWKLDEEIEKFETRGDIGLDQNLGEFDVYCSLAHVSMLSKIGIISNNELLQAKKSLLKSLSLIKAGKFSLEEGDEDIHTKIENFVTSDSGEVGKKMHTGRSRNDQVLTDMRLYTKSNLLKIWKETILLSKQFAEFAKKYEFMAMPGYTHMQKAMPSSVGMWAASFSEALLDDLALIKTAYALNDKSPLGSAAAYGVPLDLDREYTAKILGFNSLQKNSLYCQNSRGKAESETIAVLNSLLFDINKFASDVMLFTTSEFGYFKVDEKLCSGSSIMPQKKNIDVAELLRSKIHLGLGYYAASSSLASNLPSGYNRDLQDGKPLLMKEIEVALESLKITGILLNGLHPNVEKMKEALTPEIFATHNAIGMVAKGKPFRDAYKAAGKKPNGHMPKDIGTILKSSKHLGGTGNLSLGSYLAQAEKEKNELEKEKNRFENAINALIKS